MICRKELFLVGEYTRSVRHAVPRVKSLMTYFSSCFSFRLRSLWFGISSLCKTRKMLPNRASVRS